MSVAIKKMKWNKAADEGGVIAEYMKALVVEAVEKLRGFFFFFFWFLLVV